MDTSSPLHPARMQRLQAVRRFDWRIRRGNGSVYADYAGPEGDESGANEHFNWEEDTPEEIERI